MRKRIVLMLLTVCLLTVMVPVTAGAVNYGTCGDNVTWSLQDGILTLEGTGATWAYVGFNTPPWWTAPTKRIHTVVVGEGITQISAGLFMGESNLVEVKLPSTLRVVGSEVFSSCENLKQIEIPDGVTAIGDSAFDRCSALERIDIPDSVTSLGSGIFGACTALESIKLPSGLTAIGGSSFSGCTALKTVDMPSGVTSIGKYAFYGCESLTTMKISAQITEIGEHALEGCMSLDGIWVDSDNPNYAGDDKGVLYNKDKTQLIAVPGRLAGSYTIPDSVTKLDSYAFRNCTALTELIFPAGLTELAYRICEGCTALERVVLGENLATLRQGAFLNCTALKEINIPKGVTEVSNELFRGCSSLKTLTLPEGITTIGEYAFADCSALESINFPGSLTKIDDQAFSGCASLKELPFPEGLKTIGWNTFSGCDSLTRVGIPASVTSIDEFAFSGCDSLEGFSVAEGSASYVSDARGVLYNKKMTTLIAAPNKLSGSFTVPQGVTSIYGGAFSGSAITEILLPDTLIKLGWKTFTSCQNLTEITIPDSVKEIGMYSFSNCRNLERVTLSASLEEIEEGTFYQCTGLKRIDIPASVEDIRNQAFKECTNLEEVTFADSMKKLDMAVEVFYDCDKLTEVVLPEGTGEIWYGAFAGCDMLREVTIPGSVYYIDEAVFYQCGALTDVYFQGTEARLRQIMEPALNSDAIKVLRFDFDPSCPEDAHTAITDNATDVTCTQDGLTEGSHCGVCGTVLTAQTVIPAKEHQWDQGVQTQAPTETVPGVMTYTCMVCGETRTEEIPVHVHVYAKFHWLATCTEEGHIEYLCSCGHTYTGDYVDALGHEWDEGQVTREPTLTAEGERVYTCTREKCGETRTEAIPVTEHVHSYEPVVTEPTCTAGGYTTHTCACGDSYTDSETAALGHSIVGDACVNCGAALTGSCGDNITWTVDLDRGILKLIGTGATGDYWRSEPAYIELPGGNQHYIGEKEIHEVPWKPFLSIIDYCIVGSGITHIGKGVLRGVGYEIFTGDMPKIDIDGNENVVSGVYPAENATWEALDPDDLHDAFGDMRALSMSGQCGESVTWKMDYMTGTLTFSGTGDMYSGEDVGYGWFYIDPNTFRSDDFVERIVVEEGITSIGPDLTQTGYGNSYINLRSVELPSTLRSISYAAFSNVDGPLTEIELPDGLEVIEAYAFDECPLTELRLPDSLVSIGNFAFCQADLTSLEIPGSVREIGDHAFASNTALTDITICSDELEIGYEAFGSCHELKTVTVLSKSLTFGNDPFATQGDSFMGAYIPGSKPDLTIRCYRGSAIEEFAATNGYKVEYLDDATDGGDITRLAGGHRYETAFLAADQMKVNLGIEKFDTVVVASGTNFADALSGSYLAAVKDAPILLACNVDWVNELVKEYIRANLNSGGTVYILGGEGAVPVSFESNLDGFTITRLAGDNRFLTNLDVLKEAGVSDQPILVCTGLGFADSLSASASKLPILLVYGDKLMEDQAAFMESVKGRDLYIIGGDGAVSAKLEDALSSYGEVTRLAGGNRFETSVLIAGTFFEKPKSAVLAYAWDFPDGLCGGPLATTMNAPLILTMEKYEAKAVDYIHSNAITQATILGGEKLIPESSVNKIFP